MHLKFHFKQAVAVMTFQQASQIKTYQLRGFSVDQVSAFNASGPRSLCAQMTNSFTPGFSNGGLAGLTPACTSIMSDSAISGIADYSIQNITMDAFRSLRNYGALNTKAMSAASMQQYLAIPSWPSLPFQLIMAAFGSSQGASLANTITPDRLDFSTDNDTLVKNVIWVKSQIAASGLGWDVLDDKFAAQNPSIWNWIHVATIVSPQMLQFWTDRFPAIPPPALVGLQASQVNGFYSSLSLESFRYLLPDFLALNDQNNPARILLNVPLPLSAGIDPFC
jgi:hypothetical protein